MKKNSTIFFIVLIFFFLVFVNTSFSGDLDDGMSKYTDDGISSYDNLGDVDKNIKFIKLDAKSKAEVRTRAAQSGSDSGGSMNSSSSANMNSVVLGAGGTIKGDIIIIDESRGNKTQVVDK